MQYNTLVLSSGGLRGFCHVGALIELHKIGWLNNIKTIIATSAGSIVGLLISLGYTYPEIYKLSSNINFSNLLNSDLQLLNLFNLTSKFGLFNIKNTKIYSFLITLIKRSRITNNINITFKELYKLTSLDFQVCATNINTKSAFYFSYKNSPDTLVIDAVLASANIPFLFSPFKNIYLDGALIEHYPINQLNNNFKNVIGIVIIVKKKQQQKQKDSNFKQFLYDILNIIENSNTNNLLNFTDIKNKSIVIECEPYQKNPYFNNNTKPVIRNLINIGQKNAKLFIKKQTQFYKNNINAKLNKLLISKKIHNNILKKKIKI